MPSLRGGLTGKQRGFASVRSRPAARGLPGAGTCLNELRGDNKQFNLSLLTDDGFDSLNHQTPFEPATGAWQVLHLSLIHISEPTRPY